MSAIGPGINSLSPLAGALVAAQRGDLDLDPQKADAADRMRAVEGRERSARAHEDVGEADLSADRDADGRQAEPPARNGSPPPDEAGPAGDAPLPADALGERGTRLDLSG